MDLLTGSFLWSSEQQHGRGSSPCKSIGKRINDSTPTPPSEAQIVILGGGISGAISAFHLTEAGYQVVVLEKRGDIAEGSTLASTAILQYELDLSLTDLSNLIGKAQASLVYRASFRALQGLCKLAESTQIDCDFSRRPAICLANSSQDAAALEIELRHLIALGFEGEYIKAREISSRFPFSSVGALFHKNAAQLNPVKLCRQLLSSARAKGAIICTGAQVSKLLPTKAGAVNIVLENGGRIEAQKVILATGYESGRFFRPKHAKLTSTYAAATYECDKADLWEGEAVIWETARPYHYLRTAPGPRIIIGGGDAPFRNSFLRDLLIPYKRYRLAKKLESLNPKKSSRNVARRMRWLIIRDFSTKKARNRTHQYGENLFLEKSCRINQISLRSSF